jgi:hypothetical protein
MRTTLDIDDDVLLAVKELSRRKKKSSGEILSELARKALTTSVSHVSESVTPYGFPLIPRKSDAIVTVDHIRQLQEESDL